VRRLLAVLLIAMPQAIAAQTVSQRGFVEATGAYFPQDAPNDSVNGIADLLFREELVVKPAAWVQFAAGADLRANTHDQVDASWRVDWSDRTLERPAISIRRLSATVNRGRFTVDGGKQFVRWGRTDIVTPTDWFAPRDFLNVFDNELLPVTGVRAGVRFDAGTIEGVWVPRFTPSRIPLVNQRWVVPPPGLPVPIAEIDASYPDGAQAGLRWSHAGSRFEYALAFFDGFNHLPNLEPIAIVPASGLTLAATYPSLRSVGGDAAIPTPWLTLKVEAAYFASSTPRTDEYVLYVIQVERQSGEWAFVGGYAGEHVTRRRAQQTFAPDRGLTRAFVGRADYTINVNRTVALEGAVRENGDGAYLKAEYSQAARGHWRTTVSGTLIAGEPADFIGQYERNSHVMVGLRYSF
jgi:hypothetical protein